MLKRLKRRFILINMLLVGVAVAVMFGAVCVLTYRNARSQVDRAIENALRVADSGGQQRPWESGEEPPAGEAPGSENQPDAPNGPRGEDRGRDIRLPSIGGKDEISYVYTVTVILHDDGSYTRLDMFGADMEDEILDQAVAKVAATSKSSGTIRSLNLAWRRVPATDGACVVFASTDYLSDSLRSTAIISGAVCVGSLLLFFGVSYVLAGIVIRPTAEAWEKQKRFVADASHDLKTPLTVILANADILRAKPSATVGEQMQWVEGTAEEAERMRGLVNQMLELAKSEDAQRTLTLSPLSLSELTERTVLQFEPLAFERGITLESEIDPNVILPSHSETFVRLAHILLDNAVKYSPDNAAVTVRLQAHGTGAVFSVQNFGTPISPNDLPHLFERFWRADKARSVGGFGLGLSIAKNLAEALRGKISVTSTLQTGTVFSVRF